MQLTNTKPLIGSLSDNRQGNQGMRRNASGMLAGEQMFRSGIDNRVNLPHEKVIQDKHFNNRLRENWLQQQYDEDRMLDSLDQLKSTYGKYGGKDADFVNQVRDLENYTYFNRSSQQNPIANSVPYINNGQATTFAKSFALPPQIYPSPILPYYAPYIDQDRRMLRTNLIAQKQTINELQEELSSVKRESQRFDDIMHQGHNEIHKLQSSHFPGNSLISNNFDPRQSMVKWGDAETDHSLHNLALKEQELIRVLSKLPENSDMYKQKRSKLDDLVRQRVELERMLYTKADQKHYVHEKIVDDQKKDNLAQWLRRDLELFKIDKTEEQEYNYKMQTGFIIYWDYILNLIKEFRQVQIVYGIYNKGLTLFEPRLVPLSDTIDTTHPNFCQVLFGINHLVRDIEPHPDILLIFEIQVPANKNMNQVRNSAIQSQNKLHTGYLLSRYGKLRNSSKQNLDEENEYDKQIDTTVFQTYGWSVLDLFNFKNDLKRGTYKIPIYKPPTIINLDVRDIPQLERIKDTMVWMRVSYPKNDDINEIRCEPSYYHVYYVPEIHNIAPKTQIQEVAERDPSYFCDGITVIIHWVKGYTHSRHVRVACAMQIAKDIIVQDNGHLCFYATRGINGLNQSIGRGILKALGSVGRETKANLFGGMNSQNDDRSQVSFNEMRTWYRDLYNLQWDMGLTENIYLIFQYLERREDIEEPTTGAVITRKIIEEEYDLVGYTAIQINKANGQIKYGSFILDLYDGPIFVEDLDPLKRTERQIKITICRPGEEEQYINENNRTSQSRKRTSDNNIKTAQSIAGLSKLMTPRDSSRKKTPTSRNKTPGSQGRKTPTSKSKNPYSPSKQKSQKSKKPTSKRNRDEEQSRSRSKDPSKTPRSKSKTPKNQSKTPRSKSKVNDERNQTRGQTRGKTPDSPVNRSFKGMTPSNQQRDQKNKGKELMGLNSGDPFDLTKALNDTLKAQTFEERKNKYFILNDLPQFSNKVFRDGSGIDFYIDSIRYLPDNATVTKIQMTALTIDKEPVSISAGGLPDLYESTTYMHYYGFRYEYRLQKFNPTSIVFITIYTVDRTTQQVRTLGYSAINMFLKRPSMEPCNNPRDRDITLQEGNYQLPVYIEDPRRLPELKMEYFSLLEKIPCCTLLIRIRQAAQDESGTILSVKTVPQNEWQNKKVVISPPDYQDSAYCTMYCRVSDVEMEVFSSRAERIENPLRETAEQLMIAMKQTKSRNTDALQQWIDKNLSIENEDPPILDIKYFAVYDSDFGFKISIDGIHNLPKRRELFYVVILSLNPPASLYSQSKVPTSDVNLICTYDWESSVLSVRFLDNYFYYQNVQPNISMTAILDVRSIEFVQGIPKMEQVAWSALPIFFNRFGNFYVRSGAFQLPLFKGSINYSYLEQIQNYEDPWAFIVQKMNERNLQLWEGVSLVVRLLDSQREGHQSRPFDYEKFNLVYIPENMMQKLNYAYTSATDARLQTTPRLSTIIPAGADKSTFQESVMRTFMNNLGLSRFK